MSAQCSCECTAWVSELGNLVTCNLSYVIFITFQVKSNITKLLFSQVICNLIILLSEVILLFVYSSYVKLLLS